MNEVISLLTLGFLSGSCAVLAATFWYLLTRNRLTRFQPVAGFLIAIAFIAAQASLGRLYAGLVSIANVQDVVLLIISTIWISASIYYWGNIAYFILPLSAAAIFLVVPDTEEIALLAGILIPAMLLAWPLKQFRIRRIDSIWLALIYVWVIAIGGKGRPASIVVSHGLLGILAFVPLLTFFRRPNFRKNIVFYLIVILLHLLSISIILALARTTPRLDIAAMAILTGAGSTSLALLSLSKRYYISSSESLLGE